MLVLSLMFLKQSYYCQCVKVNEMKTSQSSKALKRKASDNEKNNTPSKRRHNGFKNKKNYKIGKIEFFMPSVWFVGLTPHEGPLLIKTIKSECLKISILISSFHDFIVLIYVLYYWIHSWNKYCRLCHKRLSLHVFRHKTLYTIILGISTSTRLSLGQDDQRLMFF